MSLILAPALALVNPFPVTTADLVADACHAALVARQDARNLDDASWLASLNAEAEDEAWGMDDATADRLAAEAESYAMYEAGHPAW